MRYKFLFLSVLIISSFHTSAQNKTVYAGSIEFERRVNQYNIIKDEMSEDGGESEWLKQMLEQTQKVVNDIYILHFNTKQSIFKLKFENTDNKYIWGSKPSETDVITKNFETHSVVMQREVFEKTYLIKDSLQKYTWKITGESREIAGYDCKKAITKICDSVVVVAFYTTQIAVSNGPDNFNGLPGMILGIAVPRLSTTWFATKVDLIEPNEKEFSVKPKGTNSTFKQATTEMLKAMKDRGKYGAKRAWVFML